MTSDCKSWCTRVSEGKSSRIHWSRAGSVSFARCQQQEPVRCRPAQLALQQLNLLQRLRTSSQHRRILRRHISRPRQNDFRRKTFEMLQRLQMRVKYTAFSLKETFTRSL